MRLTDAKRATFRWLCSLAVGAVLVGTFFTRRIAGHYDALLSRGMVLSATVYDKKEVEDDDGTIYRIRYTFVADGVAVSDRHGVSEDRYNQIKINDTVPVTYLPGSGGRTWRFGNVTPNDKTDAMTCIIVAAGFGAFTFGFCAWGLNAHCQRDVRLLREGVAVPGVVQSGTVTDNEGKYYSLTYTYEAGGKVFHNKISVSESKYRHHTRYNPYLTVLYNATEPSASKPYHEIDAACFEAPTAS